MEAENMDLGVICGVNWLEVLKINETAIRATEKQKLNRAGEESQNKPTQKSGQSS